MKYRTWICFGFLAIKERNLKASLSCFLPRVNKKPWWMSPQTTMEFIHVLQKNIPECKCELVVLPLTSRLKKAAGRSLAVPSKIIHIFVLSEFFVLHTFCQLLVQFRMFSWICSSLESLRHAFLVSKGHLSHTILQVICLVVFEFTKNLFFELILIILKSRHA